ncbi:MAG: hypothetical protein ACK4G3_02955, partial [bacterium]
GDVDFLSIVSGTNPPDLATNVPLQANFQWTFSDPGDTRIKFVEFAIECVNAIANYCGADEVVWTIHIQVQSPFQTSFTLPDLSGTTRKPAHLGMRNGTEYRWRVAGSSFDLSAVIQGKDPDFFVESGTDGYRFDTAP